MSTKKAATKKSNGHDAGAKVIEIQNAGPVKQFTLAMTEGPGFYRLSGENGVGKSHALRAILKAQGHDVDVALRDGAKELSVDYNGETLLSLKKVKATGDVEGEIWSDCPLADFILPDAADPAVNERRRVEALMRLVDQKVTEGTIRTLLEGYVADDEQEELNRAIEDCVDNALDYVLENESETIFQRNVVSAKERVRIRVHELKRGMEKIGEQAQADINARAMPKPEVVVEISAAVAQQVYETRVGDKREKEGSAQQRAEREAERAEIEATLGERPDVEALGVSADQLKTERDQSLDDVQALERQLAVAKERLSGLHSAYVRAAAAHADALREAGSWDRRKAILDTPITGATPGEVTLAAKAVEQARETLEQARATEAWEESCRLVTEAQDARERAFARGAIYEKIATSTTGQLAVLLAKAGVEGLTVENDQLCEIQPNGELEPVSRLSEGERTRIGCRILVKNQSVPYNVLVLPGRLVRALGPKAYAEVEQELIAAGLYAIYEQPGVGDEISAEKAGEVATV